MGLPTVIGRGSPLGRVIDAVEKVLQWGCRR